MDETQRTENSAPAGSARKKTGNALMWAVLAVVLAFIAGFGWQFYEASTIREQLTATEQELAMERLRVRLGQAALAAQGGDFESARRQMSEFFTQLQEHSPVMTPEVREAAENFLSMRDQVITGLSRSNPEYAGVLYGMLETMGNAIEESMGPAPGGGMPTGEAPDAEPRAPGQPMNGEAGGG